MISLQPLNSARQQSVADCQFGAQQLMPLSARHMSDALLPSLPSQQLTTLLPNEH